MRYRGDIMDKTTMSKQAKSHMRQMRVTVLSSLCHIIKGLYKERGEYYES